MSAGTRPEGAACATAAGDRAAAPATRTAARAMLIRRTALLHSMSDVVTAQRGPYGVGHGDMSPFTRVSGYGRGGIPVVEAV
ncbi:hypothetical protein GCM10010218_56290 [Streptomyces mashuensis]|uniref:Uncharacterized protein n=1 Tax=Streptomyces mashuensis TaxID=33904 RepID=A0A919EEV6_9ACTN|nr:hypothetical protein GCM10010218_56290 [Streptomyces mashuensis]